MFLVYWGKWLGSGNWPLENRKRRASCSTWRRKNSKTEHGTLQRKGEELNLENCNTRRLCKKSQGCCQWHPADLQGRMERNWAIAPGWEEWTFPSSSLWGGHGSLAKSFWKKADRMSRRTNPSFGWGNQALEFSLMLWQSFLKSFSRLAAPVNICIFANIPGPKTNVTFAIREQQSLSNRTYISGFQQAGTGAV